MRLRPIINIYAAIIDDAAAGSEGADRGVNNRRDRRMIKLIRRMPSCMDYMLASLYVTYIDYVLLFLCTMRFV
ncbi:hypothetical protein PAHAL_2G022400 [Panicum hallii]|jgi:hypothetical protein|uniref:Uncharacterized protein n=1 Tax=Panicum hallii TaxID=206008 RepID=A0A2T8KMJ8_9POAL|nr:hypothetical protein PAHAL_2G022400 [Panicum hallii]